MASGTVKVEEGEWSMLCWGSVCCSTHSSVHTFIIGGGDGNSLGFLKSSTLIVALIITSLRGRIGSKYKCLSARGIRFHLASSSMDCARRSGSDLRGMECKGKSEGG